MSSREDKYLFLFGLFLIIVFAIAMIALAIPVNNYSAQDDSKKPVALETNSIGCGMVKKGAEMKIDPALASQLDLLGRKLDRRIPVNDKPYRLS